MACQWSPRFAHCGTENQVLWGIFSLLSPRFSAASFLWVLFRRFQEPVGIGTASSLPGFFEEAVGNQLVQGTSHGAIDAVLGGGIAPGRMPLQATFPAELGQGEGFAVGAGLFGPVQPVDIELEGGRWEGLDGGEIDIGHGRYSVFVVSDDYFSICFSRVSLGLIAPG